MTRTTRTWLRTSLVCAVLLTLPAASVHAQDAAGALARIDSLIERGRFTEARAALGRWQREHPTASRNAAASDHAHALLLQGRLSMDADAAVDAYLALVLGYPASREAPEALLRLGQGLLQGNEPDRARAYLLRLINDYPNAPQRSAGQLWLARTQYAMGANAEACTIARNAIAARSADPAILELLQHTESETCSAPAQSTQPAPAPRPTPEPTASEPARAPAPTPAPAPAPTSDARFTVQVGAFRQRTSADNLARALQRQDFDARVVFVPANSLARVRVGAFASSEAAVAVARRIREAGFPAVVVDDRRTERSDPR